MKKFFYYIQLPNFDIAADAAATFKVLVHCNILEISPETMILDFCKTHRYHFTSVIYFLQELLTRQKSTVAEFLTKNEEWVASLTIYQIIMFCFNAFDSQLFLVTVFCRLQLKAS